MEEYDQVYFFGDKTYPVIIIKYSKLILKGGNDYEIYSHDRTIGISVKNPAETIQQLTEIFKLWFPHHLIVISKIYIFNI